MKKVNVGTKNPAKLKSVHLIVDAMGWAVNGLEVPSGVSNQPIGDEETRQGAINRAKEAQSRSECDFGIGLEGGVMKCDGEMYVCNWGAICDTNHRILTASGVRIALPDSLAAGIRDGYELGDVIDSYAFKKDVRNNEGTMGILTNGAITRSDVFSTIVKILITNYQHIK